MSIGHLVNCAEWWSLSGEGLSSTGLPRLVFINFVWLKSEELRRPVKQINSIALVQNPVIWQNSTKRGNILAFAAII